MTGVEILDRLLRPFRSHWISPAEVRAESWALGCRHQGRVLEGARSELQAGDNSVRRVVLLKAVVRSLHG